MLVSMDHLPLAHHKLSYFQNKTPQNKSYFGFEEFREIQIIIDDEMVFNDQPAKKVKTGFSALCENEVFSQNSASCQKEKSVQTQFLAQNTGKIANNTTHVNFKQKKTFKLQENKQKEAELLGKRRNPIFEDETYLIQSVPVNKVKLSPENTQADESHYDSETTAEGETLDQGCSVLIGEKYQANIPTQMGNQRRRIPRVVWNPDTVDKTPLNTCIEKMEKIMSQNVTNHEKVIKLLESYSMDTKKLLEDITKNKLYYRGYFSLNQRSRRDKTLQKSYN